MPKYNADEQKQLSEPIEIVLDGKTYIVEKISTETLKKVTDLGKDKDDFEVLIKQLGFLVGTDPNEFRGCDIRKLSKVLEFITETVTTGIAQPKNSPGPATP